MFTPASRAAPQPVQGQIGQPQPAGGLQAEASTEDEPMYATMLYDWLSDLRGKAEPPAPLSPHHNSPEDVSPVPPVTPSPASPYYPPGHVPDWADPSGEGRTSAEVKPGESPLPREETTEGDWFNKLNDKLVNQDVTPEQYDHELSRYESAHRQPQAPWLERLLD